MPTVVIGNNTGNDFSGTEDSTLVVEGGHEADNYGTSPDAFVYDENSSTQIVKECIRFTGITNISGAINVSAATFSIWFDAYAIGGRTFSLKRLLRAWGQGVHNGEDATAGECSWNCYAYPSIWTSGGAGSDDNDRSSTMTATYTAAFDNTPRWCDFTSAQLAADVQNMKNAIVGNDGWLMYRSDGVGGEYWTRFASSEHADGQRPYLTFTYTAGAAGGTAMGTLSYYHNQMRH
jgi:hypothetical protein